MTAAHAAVPGTCHARVVGGPTRIISPMALRRVAYAARAKKAATPGEACAGNQDARQEAEVAAAEQEQDRRIRVAAVGCSWRSEDIGQHHLRATVRASSGGLTDESVRGGEVCSLPRAVRGGCSSRLPNCAREERARARPWMARRAVRAYLAAVHEHAAQAHQADGQHRRRHLQADARGAQQARPRLGGRSHPVGAERVSPHSRTALRAPKHGRVLLPSVAVADVEARKGTATAATAVRLGKAAVAACGCCG